MKKIFLLLTLVAVQAQARWLTKQEAGTVIEKFHVHYNVFRNGSWTQTIDYATRVQSEDAKVNASVFSIDYNSSTDQVQILEAYTLNGKARFNVEPSAIEDRDKGESKDYDAMKERSVVFPQVQIGSKLVIKYRVITLKPTVEGRWSTDLLFNPSYFIESFKATFRSEIPLNFEVRDPRKLITVKQHSTTHIEAVNRRELPGWIHAEKDPFFHPINTTEFRVSSHPLWPEFLNTLAQDYEKILSVELPPKMATWAKQAKGDTAQRIQFLLEKMSAEFRYFGDWRRHNGGLIPRSLPEIERSRYGDCKDLSSLLVATLRKMGMKAQVALIRRGSNPYIEEPDYKLPSLNRFNHAIVYVEDGEKSYWLDPTNPVMSLQPFPDISGRPAWLLQSGRFVRLPAAKAADFEHVHEYEYRFQEADKVKVKLDAKLLKLAPYELANDLMLSSKSQVLADTLDYFSEGQEVKSFKFTKEPATARILKDMNLTLEYEAGRVTFNAGKSAFWVIPDGFLQGAFYETEDRESDLALGGEPFLYRSTRRLKDTKLSQETPEPCKIESAWMNLERTVETDGSDVVILQTVALNKPYITRAEFRTPEFKKLQAETKRCFYRSGVLIEPNKGPLSQAAY